ncbi:HAD-IC family P-type ATPase [Rhodococcus opacus]|uniref:HAD-IC family P-type ATPase n=1 Tax=Rhodococcus opacus TaxID=37919 RepID=UPI000A569782|nr:HAD-IC family P-type ATPase [Rhodococcus opacus]
MIRFDAGSTTGPLIEAADIAFSGTNVVGGDATAVVFATGMHTELGRIAALSQRVGHEESPLEKQVNRVAWLIAAVAVAMGLAFIPLGTLMAGLSLDDSVNFAIGLLVANVPEGLLPTITLALAVGVRTLARQGALVKRLSAVETLGCTSVICTDKTGTLTMNRMRTTRLWTPDGVVTFDGAVPVPAPDASASRTARAVVACCSAEIRISSTGAESGDPTEVALLHAALSLGASTEDADGIRVSQFHFDPELRRMSTVDRIGDTLHIHAKGAPEEMFDRCTRIAGPAGVDPAFTSSDREFTANLVRDWAREGLRVLAVAERDTDAGTDAGRGGERSHPPRNRGNARSSASGGSGGRRQVSFCGNSDHRRHR